MSLSPTSAPPLDALTERFLAAQLKGDRRGALAVMTAGDGAGTHERRLQVVRDAQREIGRLWEENRISVAQEHRATAIAQLTLAHLYDLAERGTPNGHRVVVACVTGEQHDFPARLVADALDLAGFDVHFLGADVPADDLVTLVTTERPALVALSATMGFNTKALRDAVRRLREAAPGVVIAVGGAAGVECGETGADVCVQDAAGLVAEARRRLEARR